MQWPLRGQLAVWGSRENHACFCNPDLCFALWQHRAVSIAVVRVLVCQCCFAKTGRCCPLGGLGMPKVTVILVTKHLAVSMTAAPGIPRELWWAAMPFLTQQHPQSSRQTLSVWLSISQSVSQSVSSQSVSVCPTVRPPALSYNGPIMVAGRCMWIASRLTLQAHA